LRSFCSSGRYSFTAMLSGTFHGGLTTIATIRSLKTGVGV
jgi:hypothetical protein